MQQPVDERRAPVLPDDLRAERRRLRARAGRPPAARPARPAGTKGRPSPRRCRDARASASRISSGPTNAIPSSPSSIPSRREHRARELDGRVHVRSRAAAIRRLDDDHRRRAVPVSSAWRLYASTIRCTSLCRTTSSFPNSTNPIPSMPARISLHLDEPGRLLAREVDLRHVTGDDHPRAEPEPREEHLHLLGRRVLRLVEDDERVVERAAAHERERRDLDRPALHVPGEPLGIEHVVERVVQRAQVRIDLREHVAREEPEPLARLDRRPREDDAADLALGERRRRRAPSRGTSCPVPAGPIPKVTVRSRIAST